MKKDSFPDLDKCSRVLIIRLSAIGDVVHALPLASALKENYPHLEITWVVEEIPADMVLGNPDLHNVIVIPRSRWNKGRISSPKVWREYAAFLGALRRARFDVSIDLQGYAKSAIMAFASGARYRLGWWRLRDGSNLVSRALPRRSESVHRVDWFLDVARALGIARPVVKFPLFVPDAAKTTMQERLSAHGISPGRKYVVINQAAGNPPRRWGRMRYAQVAMALAERYHLPVVLIGTAPEASDCEAIVSYVRDGMTAKNVEGVPVPLNLAGQTNLKELAALLQQSNLHITGDTGSTHIAAALNTPVVAFYGSTDPAHAGPWGQMENVLSRRDLCHAECTIRQCAFAPGGRPDLQSHALAAAGDSNTEAAGFDPEFTARCLAAISVEDALGKIEAVLARSRCDAAGQK